jgi:hypothetical protein
MCMRKQKLISENLRVRFAPAKFFLAVAALAFIGLASCKKDTNVGLNVQPVADILNVKVSDTTLVHAYTMKEDSLRTSGGLTNYVLGTYWDPLFGKTNASIYTQFVLPGADVNIDFDPAHLNKNLYCDSLVMTISYGTIFYGDTTSPQTIKVYRMTDQILVNTNYNSDTNIRYYPTPIGIKTFYPTPNTKTILSGHPVGTHIRVRMDRSFGQMILDQSGQQALSTNANFVTFIPGFYIHAENNNLTPGKGAMLYLPMTDTLTKLTVYYKNLNTPSPGDTTLNFSFEVNVNSARFAHFDHDYTTADNSLQNELVAASHASTTTPPNEPLLFVSSLSGTKVKVDFPNIMNWIKTGPIAVSKAQLVIDVAPSPILTPPTTPTYAPCGQLALVNIDSLGHEIVMIDNLEGVDYFGGTYDSYNNQYTFNIARYFQEVLTGRQKNRGLYLVATSSSIAANRTILGGATNTGGFKMYLRLAYNKLH